MKKFTFIAYKPSSSQANCRCGCSGYTEYESDFTLTLTDSVDELCELFYSHKLRNLHLGEGESGFDIHVLQDGEDVFVVEDSGCGLPFCNDGFESIVDLYEKSKARAIEAVNKEKEKKLAAEKEKLQKEQELRDALKRQQYEKLKQEFGDK